MAERDFSTLGYERAHNPLLQLGGEREFVARKVAEHHYRPPYFRKMEQYNLSGAPPMDGPPAPPPIDVEEFARAVEGGMVAVDVRSPEAFAGAHVPGSQALPLDLVTSFAGWLLTYEDEIGLVADSPDRAALAALHLARIGYDRVRGYLGDGMHAWEMSGRDYASLPALYAGDLKRRMEADEKITLLDVRSREAFEEEHLPGAMHDLPGRAARPAGGTARRPAGGDVLRQRPARDHRGLPAAAPGRRGRGGLPGLDDGLRRPRLPDCQRETAAVAAGAPPMERPVMSVLRRLGVPVFNTERTKLADLSDYRLLVCGLVAAPLSLTIEEVKALPRSVVDARLTSVSGFSVRADWGGVLWTDFEKGLSLLPEASHATFSSPGGYETTLAPGGPAPPEGAAGLRGGRGADRDTNTAGRCGSSCRTCGATRAASGSAQIELRSGPRPGYWESRGYTDSAEIQAGTTADINDGGKRKPISGGGEVTEF